MSTPFSRAAANRLNRMGVAAIKIGSGECNNLPLIEHIAQFGLPMIVSTGMNSTESVKATVQILEKHNADFALLHTTNLYPTPSHLVRLGAMQELQKAFPHVNVGLSDHTDSNLACIAAMSLGATIVERHFTDHMERPGPDIVNSMDTQSLKELLAASRVIPQMLGGTKQAAQEESVTMRFAFSTLVATKDIKKGDHFTVDNIWAKRPGTGEIPAAEYQETLGKLATVDIPSDTHIARNMIDEP